MRELIMKMPQAKSLRTAPRCRLCASLRSRKRTWTSHKSLRSRNEHFLLQCLGVLKASALTRHQIHWIYYSMYNNPQKDRILILKHVSQRVVNSPQSIILVFFLPLCEVLPNIILFVNVCSISLPSYHLLIVT